MSVHISPGSTCWLHPGERVVGVCAVCLKERLGRLAFLPNNSHNVPPRYSFDSSFLRSRSSTVGRFTGVGKIGTIATLIESDAENFEDSVRQGGSSASYLLRSKSLAIGKGSSVFGRSSINVNSNASQLQASEEEISFHVQANETGAKAKEESTLAVKENKDTQGLLCSNESSKGGCISRERKSLRDLFYSDRRHENASETPGSNELENLRSSEVEKEDTFQETEVIVANVDRHDAEAKEKPTQDSEVSQSIASLISEDLHSRSSLRHHSLSKVSKQQYMTGKQTEDKIPKLHNILKDQAPGFHCTSTSQSTSSSVMSFSRSCSRKVSNVENDLSAVITKRSWRSRSLSTAAGANMSADWNDSTRTEIRDSVKNAPNMKQVCPSIHNVGQDLKKDSSDNASEAPNDEKTISCLIALDLYERKQFSSSSSTRTSLWIKTFASPMQALKSKQLKKDQLQFQPESISSEKAKGIRIESMVDVKKKSSQSLPRDNSFMNFYLSPLRRSRRKWTEKMERNDRDTSNSSPSTVESSSPWSFYLTPLRSRRNKVNR